MLVSVVITNHNYGRFLGRCLRSLLNQSIDPSDYEIIVVDDASTDDSRQILLGYGHRVKAIHLDTNLGLAAASNTGIRAALGRYIVRVDADDYVHAEFLKTLMLGFEFFGKDFESISLDYLNVSPEGEVLSYGDALSSPIACGIGFKIDAIEQIGLYNEGLRLNEEVDLRKRFIEAGYQIRHIALPLYRYVQHSSSLTRRSII